LAARELTPEEQEIVQQGLQAEALLDNEAFSGTIQSLMFESWAQWTETKPADKDQREDNYNFYRGLKAIESELRGRVQAKDEIERMLNESADEDDLSA
jgi:hypothetical protein